MIAAWRRIEPENAEDVSLFQRCRSTLKSWWFGAPVTSSPQLKQIGGQSLRDIMFEEAFCGMYPAGPFASVKDFHDSFARLALRARPGYKDARKEIEELQGFTDDIPVVFTHGDLDQSNILVSRSGDGEPRIVAVIDWHQSGWYPIYWESLKARNVAWPDTDWKNEYISKILDPAPYDYFCSFEYVSLAII